MVNVGEFCAWVLNELLYSLFVKAIFVNQEEREKERKSERSSWIDRTLSYLPASIDYHCDCEM